MDLHLLGIVHFCYADRHCDDTEDSDGNQAPGVKPEPRKIQRHRFAEIKSREIKTTWKKLNPWWRSQLPGVHTGFDSQPACRPSSLGTRTLVTQETYCASKRARDGGSTVCG